MSKKCQVTTLDLDDSRVLDCSTEALSMGFPYPVIFTKAAYQAVILLGNAKRQHESLYEIQRVRDQKACVLKSAREAAIKAKTWNCEFLAKKAPCSQFETEKSLCNLKVLLGEDDNISFVFTISLSTE